MNASATDFRLWLEPTVLLIETVKRLAARVKTRSTSHDNNPSLVKKGNLTVAIKPKHTSSNPRVEMLVNRTVLFQFLFSLIVILFPAWSELVEAAAEPFSFCVIRFAEDLRTRIFWSAGQCWPNANTVEPSKDNLSLGLESRISAC